MSSLISINIGNPKHGWLPVNFKYHNFDIQFDASDVLNDPIEELYYVISELQEEEIKRITWWLEPEVYFFDFKKLGQTIELKIIESDDLHNDNAIERLLYTITGIESEIIEPFRIELKKVMSYKYEENHWPFNYDSLIANEL